MNGGIKDGIRPMVISLLMMIAFEILTTTLFPLFGLTQYRLPFNILLVLFMCFKLRSPFIAIYIFLIQYFHGFFSIEGWELGVIAGVVISILINYLKDLLHFTSFITTILVTQLFQTIWFVVVSFLIYIKIEDFPFIVRRFWQFLPESIVISVMAPFAFFILDQIWKVEEGGTLEGN